MYCKRCGTKNKDDARFCENCGQKLIEAPNTPKPEQPKQEISQEPSQEPKQPKEPKQAPKMSSKTWIVGLGCVIIVIAVIMAFLLMNSKDKKETPTTTAEPTETVKNTETKDQSKEDEDLGDQSHVLPYTDNKQMNLSACTKTSNYTTVTSKDKSFSFAYPKSLFNFSDIDTDDDEIEYTLGYTKDDEDEAEITVEIKSEDATYSNPVKNVQEIYNDKKNDLNTVSYDFPSGGKTPKVKNGKASMIVMGYKDYAETECEYVLVTSDGKKNYMMEVQYKDSDSSDQYKEINYVLDCLYRGCSFTNSTYKMRTFEQFKKDDMGQKK